MMNLDDAQPLGKNMVDQSQTMLGWHWDDKNADPKTHPAKFAQQMLLSLSYTLLCFYVPPTFRLRSPYIPPLSAQRASGHNAE